MTMTMTIAQSQRNNNKDARKRRVRRENVTLFSIIRNNFHFCSFLFVRSHHDLCIFFRLCTFVLKHYTFGRFSYFFFRLVQQINFSINKKKPTFNNGNEEKKIRITKSFFVFCHTYVSFIFVVDEAPEKVRQRALVSEWVSYTSVYY